MNNRITETEPQQFILTHTKDSSSSIALRKSPFEGISPRELAEQIDSRQRCEKKLPTWFNTAGIYYPSKLSIEQSSSEITAAYKSQLVKGDLVVDLTGGFGVDSFYISKKVLRVIHCELNPELSDIAKNNASLLQADNIDFHEGDGIAFLSSLKERVGAIYVDPSRRVKSQKVFFLKDCEPDVVSNANLLLSIAPRVMIKTSPLLDISSGLKELSHVSQIHILSIKNEVKELLWVLDDGFEGEPEIICAAINRPHLQAFRFQQWQEREAEAAYSLPLTYIYEPDAALLKSGCFKLLCSRFDILKLAKNTHLYTSQELKPDFPGKVFSIEEVSDYKAFTKNTPLKKANVVARNFPLSPEELKKKHKLEDGGEDFLIFTKSAEDKLIAIFARKKN